MCSFSCSELFFFGLSLSELGLPASSSCDLVLQDFKSASCLRLSCRRSWQGDFFSDDEEGSEDGQGDQGQLTAECEAFHLHTIAQAWLYYPSSNVWITAKSWKQQHPGWTFWNCLSDLKIPFFLSRLSEESKHPPLGPD